MTERKRRHFRPILALAVVLVLALTGCDPGIVREVAQVRVGPGQGVPAYMITGPFAGDELRKLAGRFRGGPAAAVGDRVRGLDPARDVVLVAALDVCAKREIRPVLLGSQLALSYAELDRHCEAPEIVVFVWAVSRAALPDPVVVTLCRTTWRLAAGQVSGPDPNQPRRSC